MLIGSEEHLQGWDGMPPKPDQRMARITAVLEAQNPMRSPLARWLYENHEEFAATLAKHRPDWSALAEAFVKEKLMEEANANTAKATWQRVRRKVLEERKPVKRKDKVR